jgi:exopolysaccharide biosynthesis polyprenyl glycosylphosphotransferase
MNQSQRQLLVKLMASVDLLLMVLCFSSASLIAYQRHSESISISEFLSLRLKVVNFLAFLGFLLIWHLMLSSFGLYQSRRLSTRKDDIASIVQATSFASGLVWLACQAISVDFATGLFALTFWVASAISLILSRIALRYVLQRARLRGHNLRQVLIVGSNKRAIGFARKIECHPELGYRVLGFVDDGWQGTEEFRDSGYKVVVGLSEFPRFLRENVVDEVVVALPVQSFYQQASQIVALCEQQGVLIRFLSNIFNSRLARSRSEQVDDDSVVTLYTHSMEGWPVVVKRCMDVILSSALLVLVAPLFLIVSLLIKLSSPGPVFFVQERVGLNKRRFKLYKFRTMIPDAEQKMREIEHLNEASGPVFKIKNDPRITTLGRILRKTSIDELPQLINVFRGDMSLVGPRPLPVRDYQGFDQDWVRRRFSVRPGITCLWQVNGRSSIQFDKWMELDMKYIDEWSLSLDLKILARTIPAVLKGSGAA